MGVQRRHHRGWQRQPDEAVQHGHQSWDLPTGKLCVCRQRLKKTTERKILLHSVILFTLFFIDPSLLFSGWIRNGYQRGVLFTSTMACFKRRHIIRKGIHSTRHTDRFHGAGVLLFCFLRFLERGYQGKREMVPTAFLRQCGNKKDQGFVFLI